METQTVTREKVIELIRQLPPEKLADVYDFAEFIKARPLTVAEGDEWLYDSEEELQAEDALWQKSRAPSFVAESLAECGALRDEALAEIEAGTTKPMFDEAGEFIPDTE